MKKENLYSVTFSTNGKRVHNAPFGLRKDGLVMVMSDDFGSLLVTLKDRDDYFARIYCRIRFGNPDYKTFPVAWIYRIDFYDGPSRDGRPRLVLVDPSLPQAVSTQSDANGNALLISEAHRMLLQDYGLSLSDADLEKSAAEVVDAIVSLRERVEKHTKARDKSRSFTEQLLLSYVDKKSVAYAKMLKKQKELATERHMLLKQCVEARYRLRMVLRPILTATQMEVLKDPQE